MPQKKLTKEQIDELEAVTNEFIERGHVKSLDPRDDDKSFKMKLKRDFDEKRKRVAEGLMAGHDEDHGKAEDLIIFGFEDEAAEKEFEKKVRTIFPGAETSQKKHGGEEELGSGWSYFMTASKTWFGTYARYDIGAYTSASGLQPNRLVAQINLLAYGTHAQLQKWKNTVEPGATVSANLTCWGSGMHWGTRHVIYYNNWGTSITKRFHVTRESQGSIDAVGEY